MWAEVASPTYDETRAHSDTPVASVLYSFSFSVLQWHAELDGRNVSGTVPLRPGELHRIVLEYREVRRDAYIRLLWASLALGTLDGDDDATDDFFGPHFEVH